MGATAWVWLSWRKVAFTVGIDGWSIGILFMSLDNTTLPELCVSWNVTCNVRAL